MLRIATFAALMLSLGLLVSCNGTPGDGTTSGGSGSGSGNVDVQGFWSGTYTIDGVSGTNTATGAIVTGGDAFFYDQNGVLYVLPSFDGSGSINGTMTAYTPAGTTFSDGTAQVGLDAVITVTASSITGSFTGSNASGTFTLTPAATPFTGNPSILMGNWPGFYVTTAGTSPTSLNLTVQPTGTFVGTDANGCILSGTLTPVADGSDFFTLSIFIEGSSASCYGNLTGLAYESSTDTTGYYGGTTGTYYYLVASNSIGGVVAELKAN